jgi:hypothetical protein
VSELREITAEHFVAWMNLVDYLENTSAYAVEDYVETLKPLFGSSLGDSGRVIVDRARFERLLGFAAKQFSAEFTDIDAWRNWQNAGIQPGDLEPLP